MIDAGLPARGLHGEAYRGHVFWDELFVMPLADVIVEDFLVNDHTTTANKGHDYPAVAYADNGKYVVCWADDRNGNWDIYAQMYNADGSLFGANFKVNGSTGSSATQSKPAIAVDHEGNFVICWEDNRSGDRDIYAQRFSSMGSPQGSNFKINDDLGNNNQGSPAVGMDSTGNFVVCWADNRNSDSDVYAQRYDSNGNPINNNFKVDDDAQGNFQGEPDICVDCIGNFVICWRDMRNNGDSDIYAQVFDSGGNAEGANFKVNDDSGQHLQSSPKVACDDDGNFVVCWEDERDENSSNIYAQRYINFGTAQGPNFMVSDDLTYTQQDPSISMDDSGRFVICWQDFAIDWDYGDIFVKRYDKNGNQINSYNVNNEPYPLEQTHPSVGMNGSGEFVICWKDERDYWKGDIFAQKFNENGAKQGGNFKVNDVFVSVDQYQPAVAVGDNSNFVVCWVDDRNDGTDIYAQRLDGNGALLGNNFLVSDDNQGKDQWNPAIGIDASGGFVVCWTDERNYFQSIYARRYDNNGSPLGASFKVNDSDDPASAPDIAVYSDGSFIICWMDGRYSSEYDIFAQRFDSNGNPLGTNFKVNDDNEQYIWHTSPAITVDGNGRFVICWEDERNGIGIYCQRYASDGSPMGNNFEVTESGRMLQWQPDIAADSAGNFIVCWSDDRNGGGSDIYAQLYDQNGAAQGSNFKVNDDSGTETQGFPAVAINKMGNFVISWVDDRNGESDIYAQQYTSTGRPIEQNYKVNNDQVLAAQMSPDVACSDSVICFAWQDGRSFGHGWDIFARIENFMVLRTLISLPDTIGSIGGTIGIPVTVSTDSAIGFAQFVVEFDSSIIEFSNAQVGSDASNFQVTGINANLPFAPTHPDVNNNVLVQVSGGGTFSFSGKNQQVIILIFNVVGVAGESTGLYFDRGENKTFLTTINLNDMNDGKIRFTDGSLLIPDTITISGFVYFIGTDGIVPNAEINLDGQTNTMTDNDGFYSFASVTPGTHFMTPSKTDDVNNAITGADALAVLQSLAFLIELNDDQKIAADVTMDGDVTGADGMAILRYLAFYSSNIAQTGQWHFSPEDTTFNANADVNIDFTASLKGDVNLSWINTALPASNKQGGNVFDLEFCIPSEPQDGKISIPVVLNTFEGKMNSLLLSIVYPASVLKFTRVEWIRSLSGFQKVVNSEKKGKVHVAMAGVAGISSNDAIGYLVFEKNPVQEDHVELQVTRAIVNDKELNDLPILILDQNPTNVPQQFKLFQNYPNPFNSETVIKYQLPRDVHVKLAIYNSLGQRIRTLVDGNQKSGVYTIRWNGKNDDDKAIGSGIYLVRIETDGFSANKKMILLR